MCDETHSGDWAYTPPDSPGKPNIQNTGYNAVCFRCLGPVTRNSFHAKSFLSSKFNPYSVRIENIVLFRETYSFWSALTDSRDTLFNLCRKSLMQLHDKSINVRRSLINGDNALSNVDLRRDVYSFLNYLYVFVILCDRDGEKSKILKKLLPNIEINLRKLRLLFDRLSFANLPDCVIANYLSLEGFEAQGAAHTLIHCHLDARWLCIKILDALRGSGVKDASMRPQVATEPKMTVNDNVLLLMYELVWLSKVRHEKFENATMSSLSSFTCTCIKELWLLLINFLGLEDFWIYFNKVMCVVLSQLSPPDAFVPDCSKLHIPEYVDCKARDKFTLWMLVNVAQLYEEGKDGGHLGKNERIKHNFQLLDCIVKSFLDSNPSEEALRRYIPLLHSILNLWGHEQSDAVILLWESFHKKLNSAFSVPDNKLDSLMFRSYSAEKLIKQIKNRLKPGQKCCENEKSFNLFLKLLGAHLKNRRRKNIPSHKLCGRIYIKFPPTNLDKLVDLSELGWQHLASLYLTLAVSTEAEPSVKELVELLTAVSGSSLSPAKRTEVRRWLTVCLLLLVQEGCSIADFAQIFLSELNKAIDTKDFEDLRLLIGGLCVALEDPFRTAALIDHWVGKYLKNCPHSDTFSLLTTFKEVIEKLRLEGIFSRNDKALTLKEKLIVHVLPALSTRPTYKAAELAAEFSLLFFEQGGNKKEMTEMYHCWTSKDDMSLVAEYLSTLFSNGNQSENLKADFPNCQSDIMHCWVRCHLTTKSSDCAEKLSPIINTFPRIRKVCHQFNDYTNLSQLIEIFGTCYARCQSLEQKSDLRNTFSWVLGQFSIWIQKDMKLSSGVLQGVTEIYQYAGEICFNCGHLAYEASNPRCLLKALVDHLLLPPQIYASDFILSTSVVSAIFTHLPKFIHGLIQLITSGPSSDGFLRRKLREIIRHYFFRLIRLTKNDIRKHPLFECIVHLKNAEPIAEEMAGLFLKVKDRIPDSQALHAIRLFSEASKEDLVTEKIFRAVVDPLLHFIMMMEDYHVTKIEALKYLEINIQHPENRRVLLRALLTSCSSSLSFSSIPWFKMVLQLIKLSRQLRYDLMGLLPAIEEEVKKVENRRGVNRDRVLRDLLEQVRTELN